MTGRDDSDSSVVPGLLFLAAELVALAAVGYVIVRTALRESDDRAALAQGLVVGPAIWGVVVNLVMYAIPGTRRSGSGLDIRAGAGRGPCLAHLTIDSAAAARGGRIRPGGSGTLLGRARQPADVGDTRRSHAPGAARIDPRGRVSTRAAVDSGRASPLPLWRRSVNRAAGGGRQDPILRSSRRCWARMPG